ncbi:MAG: ABC transporter permease subunit [Candidatus Aminicenantes bacterium]|nr:ABC transporter permease subunit [Candidatus Aminicenantes bacterium]
MRNVWAIVKKELKIYFSSPTAYIISALFVLITGFMFYVMVSNFSILSVQAGNNPYFSSRLNLNQYVYSPFFSNAAIILLLLLPVLTMRLFAEEKRQHTDELLFTLPLTNTQIILGKYIASLVVLLVMIVATVPYAFYPFFLTKPELAPVLTGYLGIFLLGAAFIAFGLFASSLTENQIVAAVFSFGILLLLWLIYWLTYVSSFLKGFLKYISFFSHFDNLARGVVDTSDLVFYISFAFVGLFLTYAILEVRRWWR